VSDTSSSVKGETRRLGDHRAGGALRSPCEEWVCDPNALYSGGQSPECSIRPYLKPDDRPAHRDIPPRSDTGR